MADNAGDLGIDQFLGHGVADFRVGLIIIRDQLELDILAAEGDAKIAVDCCSRAGALVFVPRERE